MKLIFKALLLLLISFQTSIYAHRDSSAREVERYDSITLSNTQIRKLHSKYAGADYKLYINLPASYFTNKRHYYPTLYLLDADYSFPLAKSISEHLIDRNRIPEMILVGIAYDGPMHYRLNRTRDYTPTFVADGGYGPEFQKDSGGAANFRKFIRKELIPYIESNFPVTPSRGLVGHSYGGLFGIDTLIEEKNLFQNYLMVSASLWYDHNKILDRVENKANFNFPEKHKLYIAIGSKENGGHYKMIDEQNQLLTLINDKSHLNLDAQGEIIEAFDHDTIFPAALSRGLLKLYGSH